MAAGGRHFQHRQSSFPPPYPSSTPPAPAYFPLPPGVEQPGYRPPPPPYDPHYLRYPHHSPPPPALPMYFTPEQQSIRTLFVSGLPDDVKAREIHNLFRRRQGFESCQLKYTGRGDQVVAFATFLDHRSAIAAMSELNETIFDPQTGTILHIELARSNSRTKRRGDEFYTIIDKRIKVMNEDQETSSNDGDGGSDEPLDPDNDKPSNKASLHAIKSDGPTNDEVAGNVDLVQATGHEKSDKPTVQGPPPCSTLFISNLGPNCMEEELKKLLSQCSGFQFLKIRGRAGNPVAFADFKDIESSTEAMSNLEGKLLDSSDHGGMHLEYARSKMRKG